MTWKLVLILLALCAPLHSALGGFAGVSCLDWSPDGTQLLFSHNGELHLASAPDGRSHRALEQTVGVDWARFHPSGEWIAYVTPVEGGYALWRHPLDEEEERTKLHESSSPMAQPAIAPDGTRVAFLSNRDGPWDLYLLDLESEKVDRLTHTDWPVSTPDFSPDSRSLVFVGLWGDNWDLFILDIERKALERITSDAYWYWTPRFSPDGDWIAMESRREGQSDVYVIRRDGTSLTPFTQDRWRNAFPAWAPDGDSIVYASNRVSGWVFIEEGTY